MYNLKKILLALCAVTLSVQCFGAVAVSTGSAIRNENPEKNKVKDWMRTKVGRVLVFDKKQGIAVINNTTYILTAESKVYDGTPKRSSLVKFTTNENKEIVDLWLLKTNKND